MNLTPTLATLLLLTPAAAFAQTHKPAASAHRTAAATTSACPELPTMGAAIPKVAGCPKTLYALRYIDLVVGQGPLAQPLKLYTVHYTGYLLDGTKFDSSLDRKEPIVFPAGVHRVIAGWDTGFEGMHVGGKRRLFIPYQLAYGDAGKPPTIPAKSELIFDVELIAQADFPQQPPPQQAPPPAPSKPPAPTTPPPPKPNSTDTLPSTTKPLADPTKPTATTPRP